MIYRHTQLGSVIIVAIALGLVIIFASLGITTVIRPIPIAVILLLGFALIVFHSLTVEIGNSKLECHFGPGIIRKTLLLSEIDDAKKVQIPWYSGWGIRWIPGQYLLWRVSGFQAVELVMKDGSRFRIGTDKPDELVHAIRANKKN
jgi:hypothetical protein